MTANASHGSRSTRASRENRKGHTERTSRLAALVFLSHPAGFAPAASRRQRKLAPDVKVDEGQVGRKSLAFSSRSSRGIARL